MMASEVDLKEAGCVAYQLLECDVVPCTGKSTDIAFHWLSCNKLVRWEQSCVSYRR